MQASVDWNSLAAALAARLAPTQSKMSLIADFEMGQVRARFQTAGASGGTHWPPTVTPAGKKPPLMGLEGTYRRAAGDGWATVGSGDFRAYVAHLGTKGKGGSLPDVVPTKAKVLFIPLTNVGLHYYWTMKSKHPVAPVLGGGHYFYERPTRIFGGHPGEAIRDVDYIFRPSKADPPRPQLPTSDGELAALKDFVASTLAS